MARMGGIDSQFKDDNGNPLALGTLYFYEAGTNIEKATYSDRANSSLNAQPVVLDESGVMGDVWFAGTARVVLYDAAGVQQREMDPVGNEIPAAGSTESYWIFDLTIKTASFTGEVGYFYFADVTSGAITLTLPASPSVGDRVGIASGKGTNNIILASASENIQGSASNYTLTQATQTEFAASLRYVDATQGWVIYDNVTRP